MEKEEEEEGREMIASQEFAQISQQRRQRKARLAAMCVAVYGTPEEGGGSPGR